MKKYIAAAIGLAAAFALFYIAVSHSASTKPAVTAQTSSPRVTAAIFPYYDFARQIGGERIKLTLLLKPGVESHTFDPSPQDMLETAKSDLFLYTGGENDKWAVKTAETAKNEGGVKPVELLSAVKPLEEECGEEHGGHDEADAGEHDHGHGHEHETDEHIWTSPQNALKIAGRIKEALCEAAPQNKEYYEKNFRKYAAELRRLDADYAMTVKNAKRKTLVFGDRYPFRYLDAEFGLHADAAFPGCAAETEASAATVARLINIVKKESIPVVFHIEMSSQKTADAICRETGAKKMLLHSCHNVTPDELKGGATYIGIMRGNLKALREALN